MREAAATTIRLDDIKVTASASASPGTRRQVRVELAIDPSNLSLVHMDGRWTGSIDLMIVCADLKDNVVGMIDQRMELSISDALYAQARITGIPYQVMVDVRDSARRVKAIVYNYDSDRLGGAIVDVK